MGLVSMVCLWSMVIMISLHQLDANLGNTNYNYDTDITFLIYDWTQSKFAKQATTETNFAAFGCKPADPFVVVLHGWSEGCTITQWVQETLNNFIIHRKGCVLCLDYSVIADNNDYFTMVKLVDPIARTLEKKLRQLIMFGIAPANGMLYGFSLGSQVAFQAGRNLAPQKLGRIDACDPAGVAFDTNTTYTSLSVMDAATEVQCIHTSSDIGTTLRVCHKDWLMGYCGWLQFAAGLTSSHGLCPIFYNIAFWYDFKAISNPYLCPTLRAVSSWPNGFKMGYYMPQGNTLMGDLFAKTSRTYPYN
ncbi:phospholipase A1 member A-like [Anopheles moucheti]|uniref:phospholipase A1 member A-like n=1 Tax=Anopheles moucheti TaxID=186751 RepID=UPI0022F06DF5|nr:phospholipase A1 member A-like [Anopheles moucheti]